MIYADIRAGIPPAERPPDLLPHLEATWTTLESCWEREPHGRPDVVQLRVWLERALQIYDGTHTMSDSGIQHILPSLDINSQGGPEDPPTSTVSGTSNLEPPLLPEPEPTSHLHSRNNPSRFIPPPDWDTTPTTTSFIINSEGFSWTRRRAPYSNPRSQRPPPPRPMTLSNRQQLQRRLQKYQWRATFSVDTRGPPDQQLFKVSFFIGSTMIGESGWFTNRDAAKENAAMKSLGSLNTYGYH